MSVETRLEALQRLVSPQRLEGYLRRSPSLEAAFQLYEWNIRASAEALALTAMIEVLVRNAMDAALLRWAQDRGHSDWFDSAPLDGRARDDIIESRRRAARTHLERDQVRPISNLSFGFWRYLTANRYLLTLWIPSLQFAFSNSDLTALHRQMRVHSCLQQLVYLRNRAAHHEPIHSRDLLRDNQIAIDLAAMIDPVAGEWVARRSTIPAVMAAKPRFKS